MQTEHKYNVEQLNWKLKLRDVQLMKAWYYCCYCHLMFGDEMMQYRIRFNVTWGTSEYMKLKNYLCPNNEDGDDEDNNERCWDRIWVKWQRVTCQHTITLTHTHIMFISRLPFQGIELVTYFVDCKFYKKKPYMRTSCLL